MGKRQVLIYVAGKYTANTDEEIIDNVLLARDYSIKIWDLGYTAICPHLNTAHFEIDSRCDWKEFLEGDLEIISRCDAVFLLPNWLDSKGAQQEREHAIIMGKRIFYNINELEKWKHDERKE